MTERNTGSLNLIEQAVLNRISQGEIKGKIHQLAMPYKELMAYYRCAMMQVETNRQQTDQKTGATDSRKHRGEYQRRGRGASDMLLSNGHLYVG